MRPVIVAAWRAVGSWFRPSSAANARGLRERRETLSSLGIREATAADIPALAQLHVTTWNATYAPLLMNGPPVAVREYHWREAFATLDDSWFCFVVHNTTGELVGFAKGQKSSHPEYGGQLSKIYLLRGYQRLGLGRRLIGHVARRFLTQGITAMWLFSDARNPSCKAWVALGAIKTDAEPGSGNYGWRDLRVLAARCPIE